jgi:LysM repeat protein
MRWKLFIASAILASLVFQVIPSSAAQPDALPVPFSTQFDGSAFAASDCGPASVAMAINYATGDHLTALQVRQAIAKLPGGGYASNPDNGTAIGDLARIARAHNVETFMGDGAASTGWGPERIRNQLAQDHPVIVLTRIGYLPGYNTSKPIDHYIILTGASASGYVYNDPAMSNGARRTITDKQLQLAERMSSVPGQGAAFAGPANAKPTPTTDKPAQPDTPTTHVTVLAGDTLSQIAERYGVELKQIMDLNPKTIKNANHIEVGQVLVLPAGAAHEVTVLSGGLSVVPIAAERSFFGER